MSAQSEQYAVALFELANESNQLKEIQSVFSSFLESLDETSIRFFKHPNVHKEKKKAAVKAIGLSSLFEDFLCVIIDNNRSEILSMVYKDFNELIDRMHDVMQIHVYSKTTLSPTQINNLRDSFEKKYQRKVLMKTHLDESIIGGLRFEYEGKVMDQTVNQTLLELKRRLTK